MLPGVAVALSLLLRKPSLTKRYSVWIGVAIVVVAAFALLFVRYQKGLIGTAYEPQAFEILSQMRQRGWGVSLDNAFPLSIVTQTYQFFHYLLLWVVPYIGWMSIDVRQPFATGLFELPYAIGFGVFCLIPLLSARLIWQGGRKGLLGFGLLCPWILFLLELVVVRVAEVFVIYRSYLWMSFFPLAMIALATGLTRRIALLIGGVIGIGIFSLSLNRLDTFSDHIKLWTDAIVSNQGKVNQGAERAYFKRGMAYREYRRYNEAIDDFKAGYALLSTSNSYAKAGDRGIIYFQFNYLVEVTEDLAEVHRLTEVLREHPESAATYLERGKAFVRLLNPAQAVNDFSRALQLDPKNTDALRNRAMVLFKAGGASDALSDLNLAIEINPRFAKAYMNRGIVLAAKRQAVDALADLAKAASLDPRDPEIHFNRGNIHLLMGRFDEAFGYFTLAIRLDPKLADAYVNRGGIYMQRGRYTEAVKEFDTALALNPDIENAYMNRARIYSALSEKKKAMDDLGSVLKLNHQNKEALLQRGLLLLEEKHIREARISLQRSCDAGSEAGCAKIKELFPI